MLSDLGLRIPMALFFGSGLGLGLMEIELGAPCASCGSVLLALWHYKSRRWKKNTVITENKNKTDI